MSDKFFLDTNIFVYCYDATSPAKQKQALALIAEALQTGKGCISTQVIQEFLNVALRKFSTPLKIEDAILYMQKVLYPLCHAFPDLDLYKRSLELLQETGYSFYDSLILAGAESCNCSILYSEDLKSGQSIGNIKIVNPFE